MIMPGQGVFKKGGDYEGQIFFPWYSDPDPVVNINGRRLTSLLTRACFRFFLNLVFPTFFSDMGFFGLVIN